MKNLNVCSSSNYVVIERGVTIKDYDVAIIHVSPKMDCDEAHRYAGRKANKPTHGQIIVAKVCAEWEEQRH